MSARPYVGRALKLLGRHKLLAAASVLLTFATTLSPFIVSATFGPLLQILSEASRDDRWDQVWTLRGSVYSKADPAGLSGFEAWLATPLPFGTILALWAGALLLGHFIGFIRTYVKAQLDRRLITETRQQVYDHMQSLSLDFFLGGKTGALMQRVLSETMSIQRLITGVLLTPILDVIVLIMALAFLLGLSWQMTLVSFALAPLAFFMFKYTGTKLQLASMDMALNGRRLGAELEETISGIADIQVFNAQRRRSDRFREASDAAAKGTVNMLSWIVVNSTASQVWVAASTAVVLLVGVAYGPAFGLTLASLLIFVQFIPTMFDPVQRIISSYGEYQSLVPNLVSTYQLLDTKPTVREKPDARDIGEVHGNIIFDNVVFGYAPGQNVLDGTSFYIREGETIALVGAIGSGKSTIFNLLLRFIDPQSGRILLDGRDITDATLHSLRTQVSKLSQFPFFMKETIRENVRLGKVDATDAEVEEACKLANIHDVIADPKRLALGYDTIVDVQVPSGGQKRLIALARCLLRKPEVLLLDEPTENLDATERHLLVNVIRGYARDRTCIVISHDMDFIAAVADRILFLHKGKVAEEGTHEELMQKGGLYKSLYEVQNVDPALLRSRATEAAAGAVAVATGTPDQLPPGGPTAGGGMPDLGDLPAGADLPPGFELPAGLKPISKSRK